jgi:hypothetical protein
LRVCFPVTIRGRFPRVEISEIADDLRTPAPRITFAGATVNVKKELVVGVDNRLAMIDTIDIIDIVWQTPSQILIINMYYIGQNLNDFRMVVIGEIYSRRLPPTFVGLHG